MPRDGQPGEARHARSASSKLDIDDVPDVRAGDPGRERVEARRQLAACPRAGPSSRRQLFGTQGIGGGQGVLVSVSEPPEEVTVGARGAARRSG